MKNRLLFSTALVAAAFCAAPAYASDPEVVEKPDYTGVFDSLENRVIDVTGDDNTIADVTISGVSKEGDTYVRNGIFGTISDTYNTGGATISGTNNITDGGAIELSKITVEDGAVINISGQNDLLPDGEEGREDYHKGSLLAAYEELVVNSGSVINVTNGGMLLAGKKDAVGTFTVNGGSINVDNSFLIADNNGTVTADGSALVAEVEGKVQSEYATNLSKTAITTADLADGGESLVSKYAENAGVVQAQINTKLSEVAEGITANSEETTSMDALKTALGDQADTLLEGIENDGELAAAIKDGSLKLTADDFAEGQESYYDSAEGDAVNQAAVEAYNADETEGKTALTWAELSAEAQKGAQAQIDAAVAAAGAPVIRMTGDSTVVGNVGLTDAALSFENGSSTITGNLSANDGGVTTVAANSELNVGGTTTLAQGSITNVDGKFVSENPMTANDGSEINLTGEIHTTVKASGTVNVNGSDAYISKYTAGTDDTLNINASTSVSELFGSESSATNVNVAEGTTFVIDSKEAVEEDEEAGIEAAEAINFTATNTAVSGTLKFADEGAAAKFDSTKNITVSETGTLDAGLNTVEAKVTTEKGATLAASVANGKDEITSGKFANATVGEGTKVNLNIAKDVDLEALNDNGLDLGTGVNDALKNEDATFGDNLIYKASFDEDGKLVVAKESAGAMAANLMAAGVSANAAAAATAWTNADGSTPMGKLLAESIYNNMQNGNAHGAASMAEAAAPTAAPMVRSAETQMINQVYGAVSSRLSGGAIASSSAGKSSGDSLGNGVATWVRLLISRGELDSSSKAQGFDIDTTGIALGVEKQINSKLKAGIAYAYGDSEIDAHLRDTDVESHTFMAYGEYKPSNWYVNGIASYGMSDYSEKKHILYGIDADYDVKSYGLQAMTGYDFNLDNYTLTPEAGLRYTHLRQDGYTDTAGQHVHAEDSDILTGIIGVKANTDITLDSGINLRPEARLAMTYDLMNADNDAVVNIGNSYYNIDGEELDRFGIEAGAGITAEINDAWDLSAGYEGRFRDDFTDHSGILSAKYKF